MTVSLSESTREVEETAHVAHILTLDGRSAKLAKWPRMTPAPAEERAACQGAGTTAALRAD